MRNTKGQPVKPENAPKPEPTDQERIATLEKLVADLQASKASAK